MVIRLMTTNRAPEERQESNAGLTPFRMFEDFFNQGRGDI